jgi:hypothetical protein
MREHLTCSLERYSHSFVRGLNSESIPSLSRVYWRPSILKIIIPVSDRSDSKKINILFGTRKSFLTNTQSSRFYIRVAYLWMCSWRRKEVLFVHQNKVLTCSTERITLQLSLVLNSVSNEYACFIIVMHKALDNFVSKLVLHADKIILK